MGKYNFRIVGSSFIKELDVEIGQSPRLESFKQPSFELSVDKIIMNESGVYKTAMYFNQIGTIDSIVPVDIEDAYEKLLLLVVNFNLGGATPQIESYSLTEVKTSGTWIDGKPIYRKVISIPDTILDISIAHNIIDLERAVKSILTMKINALHYTSSITTNANLGDSGITDTVIYIENPNGENFTEIKAIIEYTKTTD
jgi:hypothetical protein